MKTSQFIRYQKGGMAFLIWKIYMGNLLRDYQFGFGRGGGKRRLKYLKNQCGGSFAGKAFILPVVKNKVLN